MRKTGILFLTLMLLPALPALAQDDYNARITVYAAPSFMIGERVFIGPQDQPIETSYEAGWKLGLRLTGDFTDRVSGEATYNFGRNGFHVVQPLADRTFDVTVHQFAANGIYHFAVAEEWRPYVTAGLGLTRYSPTDEAQREALAGPFLTEPTRIEGDSAVAFNFGGGAERQLGDGPWAIRLDLRDYVSGHPSFGLPETPLTPGGAFMPTEGVVHNVEATIGLSFYF